MNALPEIDSERLWARLITMGTVGATPGGGCNRQALTDEDRAGRELFIKWCKDAGCTIRLDKIGNIFARREGQDVGMPPVITGSHLDTQPTGGRFDGIYGVLAGLEVIETLNDADIVTEAPIEVVVWTNEEGCRFDTAMMGSAVWSGQMKLEDAYALTDASGATVAGELNRIGHLGDATAQHYPVKAAFEAHIEQGPILEATDCTIGIVTGVQHMSRHRIDIEGQEAHAGPTPMSMRKDPMMALARFLPRLYDLAEDHAPDGRMTFGVIHADPASNNTVPGHLMLTADIRHPQLQDYNAMVARFKTAVEQACSDLQLACSINCFWEAPGVAFDEDCINAVRNGVRQFGYRSREMFSGAGHDAVNVSSVAPTAMIFIPCENGLSHNEAENASQVDVAAGCNVLLHAMAEMATTLN